MRKKAVVILLALCLVSPAGWAQSKFKFAAGTAILGGGLTVSFVHGFSPSSPLSVLSIQISPRFGQFLTRYTMLFTFCNFQLDMNFYDGMWSGGLDLGAEGRYFFSTEGAADFFIGLDAAFGLKLVPDFSALQEHLLTGVALGLFVPMNEKVAFDFSLNPVFYIPLNSYQPFALFISLKVGIVSAL